MLRHNLVLEQNLSFIFKDTPWFETAHCGIIQAE